MMPQRNIRNFPQVLLSIGRVFFAGLRAKGIYRYLANRLAQQLPKPLPEDRPMLQVLNSPMFWDKKVRIAMLTFATFAAMC